MEWLEKKNVNPGDAVFFERGGLILRGSNYSMRNNYIHHACYCGLMVDAVNEFADIENLVVSGNLIEKNLLQYFGDAAPNLIELK